MYLYILVFILIHGYTYAHIHRYRPTIDRFEIDSLLGNHPTPIHAPASQWAGRECAGTETLSVCHKLHPALDSASIPCQPLPTCRMQVREAWRHLRCTRHSSPATKHLHATASSWSQQEPTTNLFSQYLHSVWGRVHCAFCGVESASGTLTRCGSCRYGLD